MSYLNPDRDRAAALVYTTLLALYLTGEEDAAAYLMSQLSGELLGQVSELADRDIATGMAHALRAHAEPSPDMTPASWQPDDVDDEPAYEELTEEEQDERDRYENTPRLRWDGELVGPDGRVL